MELGETKQQHGEAHERKEAADLWDHTAVAAERKLVVSLVVGKRTQEQTLTLVNDTKRRLHFGHLSVLCTDASGGYASALLEVFGRHDPQPRHGFTGRVSCPVVWWLQGVASVQVYKLSQGGRVVRVDVRVIRGKARRNQVLHLLGDTQINTSVVERHHGTSR